MSNFNSTDTLRFRPANIIIDGVVGIGVTEPEAFPLVIGGTPVSTDFGYAQVQIVSNSTETGLQFANTSSDGRAYTIISTGTGSGVGLGKFIIGDVTASLTRLTIDSSGNVGLGTYTPLAPLDIGGYARVYTTPLPQPTSPSLSVTGTVGETTYYYAIQQFVGGLFSQPSDTVSITGPDTLDDGNYVTITMPDSNNYIVYRMSTSNPSIPVGALATTTTAINDFFFDTPSGSNANGPLPFSNDRSTGLLFNTTGQRDIYNSNSGAGIIIGAYCDGFDSELRIVGNTNCWADGHSATYFQIQNQINNMAVFMGGTAGHDVVLDRLQFCSSFTQMTDGGFTSTIAPTGVFEIVSSGDGTKIPFIIRTPGTGQSADLTRWLAPNEGAVARVTSNGTFETTSGVQATTFAGVIQGISSGSTVTIDCSLGTIQNLSLNQNMTVNFINLVVGQRITLLITQSGGGNAITWSGVNGGGNLEVNLANNAITTLDFISMDGTTLNPVNQFGAMALPGNPKRTQATGTFAAGEQEIAFAAISYGADQNGLQIFFDTDSVYVVTEVREVVESSPVVVYVALQNSGSGSTATGNDVVSAINSGLAESYVTATIPGPGTGFVGTGSVTLSGGQDQLFTPVGGELWFDTNNLYVGMADGSFKVAALS